MREKIKDVLVGVVLAILAGSTAGLCLAGSTAGLWESSPALLGVLTGLFCFLSFVLGAATGWTWATPMVVDLLKVIKQMEEQQGESNA